MRESRICNYNDTGQRVDGMNRWLWAFVSKEIVLYLTSKNWKKKVVIKVLGEDYEGVSGQDFYSSFDGTPGKKQGVCQIREKAAETQKEKWKHPAIKTLAKRALKYKHELFTFMNNENPKKILLHPRKRIYTQQIKLKKVNRLFFCKESL